MERCSDLNSSTYAVSRRGDLLPLMAEKFISGPVRVEMQKGSGKGFRRNLAQCGPQWFRSESWVQMDNSQTLVSQYITLATHHA